MVSQTEFTLRPRTRGFHLITDEVVRNLPPLPQIGLLYLFIKHTSAALSINENADPDVRTDMESIFNHLIKEREPYYEHTLEGWDDMPAHAKSTIIGASLTIPITDGRRLCWARNSPKLTTATLIAKFAVRVNGWKSWRRKSADTRPSVGKNTPKTRKAGRVI